MSENTDLKLTVDAWADITVKLFLQKMELLKIRNTGALRDSMVRNVLANSNGDPERIVFAFNLYGRFVDMGVGRGISKGNGGDLGYTPKRKAKKWYNTVLFKEKYVLTRILRHKYGIKATMAIKDVLGSAPGESVNNISVGKIVRR